MDESSVSDVMAFSAEGSMLIGLVLPLRCADSWDGVVRCLRFDSWVLGRDGKACALLLEWPVTGVSYVNNSFMYCGTWFWGLLGPLGFAPVSSGSFGVCGWVDGWYVICWQEP